MLKAYKYRIYPNKEQKIQIAKTFGCCRFVYNQTLAYRKDTYENEKKSVSKTDCNNYCNRELKKEYEWLKDVDKFALTNAIYNMDAAYRKFFKEHAGYPKFKSKRDNHKSYTTNYTNENIVVDFEKGRVKLPKLKMVKAKPPREFEGQIKSATISQMPSGKYFVSILVEEEQVELPKVEKSVGIDLGIKDLVITSDGEKIDNLKLIKKYENKLVRQQRKLAHKQKGSKNREKQRIKVAKIYEKIANTRNDYLHKISHKLINENQVIVSEDLSVSNMVKNANLAKSISDCGWSELTRQLQYKADWYGRTYVKIGRFVPSSQTCHVCGYKNEETKDLTVRKWTCPQCQTEHDRDINAAINIQNEGLKQIA
ncbi:MAG: IS200/IS605 family element RNA-guided endonuclease TnpB [Lachnospiraceae bacterium]|nr:IS200/IS605 family element RNA-guided endonuclease TnpB [Lachnospiraceae bacterium]